MRIDDMYGQGAEGAGGGAVKEAWDEQKPNDDDKPSFPHSCNCPCCNHETISNEVTVPCVTFNDNTFTCISSGAGAGETSTQVEKYEKKLRKN